MHPRRFVRISSCAALLAVSASAQTLVAVNDTRDLPDFDLLDGVIDADNSLPGEQRTLRATLEQVCSWGGAWRVLLPAQTLFLNRFGADDLCHWGDLDLFSAGAGLSYLSIEGVPGLSAIDAAGFGPSSATADRIFDVRPSVGPATTLKISNVQLVFGARPGATFSGGGVQHVGQCVLELLNVDVRSCTSGNGGGVYAGGPLIMTGGSITQCSASIDGGGLHVAGGANAHLTSVDIVDNDATQYGGGAFLAPGASLVADQCQISLNDAQEGGGMRSRGALSLTDCVLIGNNVGGGSGGGVSTRDSNLPAAPSTLALDACVVGGCGAGSGAGVYVGLNALANIVGCSIELNVATGLGGGLANVGVAGVADSTFSDNQASSGGGAHNFRQLSLRNCTLSANRATQNGGALNLSGLAADRCTIDACTIAGNQAAQGGGIYRDGAFAAPTAEIKNTFLADNRSTSTGSWQNSAGGYPFTTHGFNVDTDGTCALGPADYHGTLAFPLYAGLGPLQFNGGPTRTHELLYCSAAHCRGDVAHMDGTSNDVDQRGVQRNTLRDAGAFDSPDLVLANYCTAGVTTNGCQASLSTSGVFTYLGPCDLEIVASNVEGQRQGVIFYGVSGPTAAPWGGGSTSWLCVKPPTQRTQTQNSGGSAGACNGSFQVDFANWVLTHPSTLGAPFPIGSRIWAQAWFRDPPSPKTTNLSDAIEIPLCP